MRTWTMGLVLLAACGEVPQVGGADAALERKKEDSQALRDLMIAAGVGTVAAPVQPSDALFELGRLLMHDKILSGNQDISCSSCHLEGLGSDDDLALSIGTGGTGLAEDRVLGAGRPYVARNAPALYNLHESDVLFWDGRVKLDPATGTLTTPAGASLTPEMVAVFDYGALSAQAMFPATGRPEMRGNVGENELAAFANSDFTGMWAALMARLGAIPAYVDLFEDAYPGTPFADMSFAHAANALAAYEAVAFYSTDSPMDEFLGGRDSKLSNDEIEGGTLFFTTAGCAGCHSGPELTNNGFRNTALAQFGPGKGDGATLTDDFGRERVTKNPADRYKFRTTPLRNVELTAPYGHTGEYRDLESFVAHYADPVDALLAYDVTAEVDDPAHHTTVVNNRAEIAAAISPGMLVGTIDVAAGEHEKIADFLRAMTGESVEDECDFVPETVPSGLSVDQGPCGEGGGDDDDDS